MYSREIEFRKIRNVNGIVTATYQFIGKNFKQLALASLFFVLPVIFIVEIVRLVSGVSAFETTSLFKLAIINYSGAYFIHFFILLLVVSYMNEYVKNGQRPLEVSETFAAMKKNAGKMMIFSLIYVAITFAYTLLFIIPGIYYSMVQIFKFFIGVYEEVDGGLASTRAYKIVHGRWWKVFGTMMVLLINTLAFTMITSVPGFIVGIVYGLHVVSGNQVEMVNSPLMKIAESISLLGNIFYLIPMIGVVFMYFSLVEETEAPELRERLAKIATPTEQH